MGNSGRRLAACALALVAITSGACASTKPSPKTSEGSASPKSQPSGCAEATALAEISASKSLFDKTCIAALAEKPLQLTFNNTDNYQHNFAVLKKGGEAKIFASPFLEGESKTVIEVPAIAAGNYRFECNIHPAIMEGDYVVE